MMINLMYCHRADGSEIEVVEVPSCRRFLMQATSDMKAAAKAKARIGAELDSVAICRANADRLHAMLTRAYARHTAQ